MTKIGTLQIERFDDALVARLVGEIDFSNAADIGLGLESGIPKKALGVVLDLSPTGYIDSAGIRILFGVAGRLRRDNRQLRLVLPADSPLQRVVRITGLAVSVRVDPSVEEALAALRREAAPRDERSWVGGADLGPWPSCGR